MSKFKSKAYISGILNKLHESNQNLKNKKLTQNSNINGKLIKLNILFQSQLNIILNDKALMKNLKESFLYTKEAEKLKTSIFYFYKFRLNGK